MTSATLPVDAERLAPIAPADVAPSPAKVKYASQAVAKPYFIAAIGLFVISVLLVALDGFDLVTTFSAVAATFNNIGPGLGVAGPTSNFAAFSDFSKVVMTMDMLLGRLEVFPMLMLFYPPLWKESIGEARIRRNRSPFH